MNLCGLGPILSPFWVSFSLCIKLKSTYTSNGGWDGQMWWWVWRHFVNYKEIFWFGILNKRAWLFSGASWVIFITPPPTPDRQFHKHLTWEVRLYQPLGRPSAKWIQRSVQKGAEIQGTKVHIHTDEHAHPHTHPHTHTHRHHFPPNLRAIISLNHVMKKKSDCFSHSYL